MIRRLFWLLAGAVLGVTGYRRAGRFARSLRPSSAIRPAGRVLRAAVFPGHPATQAGGGPAKGRPAGDRLTPFIEDVRDGMEIYLDRHAGPGSPAAPHSPRLTHQEQAALPAPRGTHRHRFRFDNAKDGR
ncbi:MAG: hypothetical protein ABJB47_11000 [Actinomycetota bacterium]